MTTPAEPCRIRTSLASTIWRQIADHSPHTSPPADNTRTDVELTYDLLLLAKALTDELHERTSRLVSFIMERYRDPTGLVTADVLREAGYVPQDCGLPQFLPYWKVTAGQPWPPRAGMPEDLDEAYALRDWLREHPSKLPPVPR